MDQFPCPECLSLAEGLRTRAVVVGNAEEHERVAEQLRRADERLARALRDGMDDSWYEEP